jgi:hypothetical protein
MTVGDGQLEERSVASVGAMCAPVLVRLGDLVRGVIGLGSALDCQRSGQFNLATLYTSSSVIVGAINVPDPRYRKRCLTPRLVPDARSCRSCRHEHD